MNGEQIKVYRFSYDMTSIEMADEVTITFDDGNGNTMTRVTSINEYLVSQSKNGKSEEAINLAKAIGNYGYYAAEYFSKKRDKTVISLGAILFKSI